MYEESWKVSSKHKIKCSDVMSRGGCDGEIDLCETGYIQAQG